MVPINGFFVKHGLFDNKWTPKLQVDTGSINKYGG